MGEGGRVGESGRGSEELLVGEWERERGAAGGRRVLAATLTFLLRSSQKGLAFLASLRPELLFPSDSALYLPT